MKLIECVPNFSEGRDKEKIERIAASIRKIANVFLLNVDPDPDANRTVMTFVGSSKGVFEAAFAAIKTAAELIDMSLHTGVHPRIGATDVCPIIPVWESNLQECADLAIKLGERVGRELGIPVYLYGASAVTENRKTLADCRRGEYEGIGDKIKDPDWFPDYGPHRLNKKSGITVIGARPFLIAYNLNLATSEVSIAKKIAITIRQAEEMKGVKAIGWYLEQYGITQVSTNITDFQLTSMLQLYRKVQREAKRMGTEVTGSELIGLVPREALLRSGKECLKELESGNCYTEQEIMLQAVNALNLNDLKIFDLQSRVLELQLEKVMTDQSS